MALPSDTPPASTIVVVPRQTLSHTRRALASLTADARPGTRIVCIDAGSASPVADELARLARAHDVAVVRTDHFLTPNEARNLALGYVDTEFVAFVDNDIVVEPGWLDALERCARETGAWVVSPLYLAGAPGTQLIHHAGGDAHVDAQRQWFVESHGYQDLDPTEALALERTQTEEGEFHCLLVRREVFERLGPLDERLQSTLEHCDLCMQVRVAGGEVWFEPSARVTYIVPRFVSRHDRQYWILRWCDAWTETSLRQFSEKWALARDDPTVANRSDWHQLHRRYAYRPYVSPLNRIPGATAHRIVDVIDRLAQRRVLERHRASLARARPPRLVHEPSWMTVGSHE
ncbi:MAG: glycosyltransferase [Acidimicrobiia bacterium]